MTGSQSHCCKLHVNCCVSIGMFISSLAHVMHPPLSRACRPSHSPPAAAIQNPSRDDENHGPAE